MEKLELKHLAPYLPYGLKIRSSEGTTKILGYQWEYGKIIYQLDTDDDSGDFAFDDPIKPILRPLSDLTKEIEIDGVKFVPVESLDFKSESELMVRVYKTPKDKPSISVTYKMMGDVFTDTIVSRGSFNETRYWIVQKLLEWHFDIFGLIEKGLAIDIKNK